MNNFLIAVFILVILALIWLFFDLKRRLGDGQKDGEKMVSILERLKILSDQSRDLRQTMDSKLSETHRATQEHISQTIRTVQGITGQSAKQIADVVAGLTELRETNKQVLNFSDQLQDLQDILKNVWLSNQNQQMENMFHQLNYGY